MLVINLIAHLKETVPDFNEPMAIFYGGIHVTDRDSLVVANPIAETLPAEGVVAAQH